jgi:selenophosphate synthase
MNQADRTLRFTGFDVANFTVGSTVAELVLQSNNETISEKDIIADLALINGKPVDVKFEKSSEAIQSVFNVSIYPNPSNGAFSVQATENAIVDVYDMNGKQITASQVISSNGKVNIDLNNVEAGVYLVRVQNETFSTTKRIVIEK